MSRWLQAKTKDEWTGQVIFDLIDKKVTRKDPDFYEAVKAAIEYGMTQSLVDYNIISQNELDVLQRYLTMREVQNV